MNKACELIAHAFENHDWPGLRLLPIADQLGLSPWQFQRQFKDTLGISPREYITARKLELFRGAVKAGDEISGASFESGFGSSSRLYEQAQTALGMTPASYKKGGVGLNIDYAIADCNLGRLLIAATDRGLCFLAIDENDDFLIENLTNEFPKAKSITMDQELLGSALTDVINYLEGKAPHPDLPLDVQATAFQRRVWLELLAIPPGQTRSYAEMAERLDLPSGQRAVARACASNKVALVIPCHRVIRSDGAYGGYRWGLGRKKILLDWEKEQGGERASH
ncbi:methylated-DNA--[protein]-cysteine S-methyltransferase [Alphaproteobacteria bacterium]|nr:methylated-DNA--[protein]-cysteine S-methyltransferase [Alphaproteobacteria bacterium]